MGNISKEDESILKAIFERCGDEVAADMRQSVDEDFGNGILSPDSQIPDTEPMDEPTPAEDILAFKKALLTFLQRIEGWRLLAKELHWSTLSDAEHRLTDDIVDSLNKYSDSIAEVSFGTLKVYVRPGMLKPVMCEITDTDTLVKNIISETSVLRQNVDNRTCYGLGSVLDDMLKAFDVYSYKAPMR